MLACAGYGQCGSVATHTDLYFVLPSGWKRAIFMAVACTPALHSNMRGVLSSTPQSYQGDEDAVSVHQRDTHLTVRIALAKMCRVPRSPLDQGACVCDWFVEGTLDVQMSITHSPTGLLVAIRRSTQPLLPPIMPSCTAACTNLPAQSLQQHRTACPFQCGTTTPINHVPAACARHFWQ